MKLEKLIEDVRAGKLEEFDTARRMVDFEVDVQRMLTPIRWAVDINFLPSELKGLEPEKLIEYYEDNYNMEIVLFDTSRQNVGASSAESKPIYRI